MHRAGWGVPPRPGSLPHGSVPRAACCARRQKLICVFAFRPYIRTENKPIAVPLDKFFSALGNFVRHPQEVLGGSNAHHGHWALEFVGVGRSESFLACESNLRRPGKRCRWHTFVCGGMFVLPVSNCWIHADFDLVWCLLERLNLSVCVCLSLSLSLSVSVSLTHAHLNFHWPVSLPNFVFPVHPHTHTHHSQSHSRR